MGVGRNAGADREPVLPAELADAVAGFATHPRLLVATDFDGTLAPLVLDPADSRPVEGSMEVLAELATLPDVVVALVSGRAMAPLRELSGAADPLVLIGSHGAEDSRRADGVGLDEEQRGLLASLDDGLAELLAAHPGARVETKPAGRVVHVRGLDEEVGDAALAAAEDLAARHPGLTVTRGKAVLELAATTADKGTALLALAEELGADAVWYAGDDVTDEHAFTALRDDADPSRAGHHLTLHVGDRVPDGGTAAAWSLPDEASVVDALRALLGARSLRRD